MAELLDAFRQKLMLQIRASHGIGSPYGDLEEEMMAAGHKPTLIYSPKNLEPALQKAIDDGDVVNVQTISFHAVYRIYSAPEHIQMAQYLAGLYQHKHENIDTVSQDDFMMASEFYRKALALPDGMHGPEKPVLLYSHESTHEEIDHLLTGRISILPIPQRYHPHYAPNRALEEAVARNTIASAEFCKRTFVSVFSQKDKIEEGKELAARYWHNEEGYPPLSHQDFQDRVGALLGYTKNDTAYFYRWQTGQISREEQHIYDSTRDDRHDARMKLISWNWPQYMPA